MNIEQRNVGKTALKISSLGLGGASLGGNITGVTDEVARAIAPHAIANGITYVDTAPYYGFGKSEHVMGDGVRTKRDKVVLSTKVGRLLAPQHGAYETPNDWQSPYPFVDVFDYTYDAIMRSYEDSLQRIGTNKIDILYVHDIDPGTLGAERSAHHWKQLETGGFKALNELKSSGAVSAIGMGVNEWPILMQALELGDWDVFLLAGRYTLLEQTSLSPFLAKCVERQTSIVVGGPFNSGILVGGTTWNYSKAPQEIIDRVAKIEGICKDHGVALPAAALQFPLAHPAVCSVLPGPRSTDELDQIMAWFKSEIPDELWSDMASAGVIAAGSPLPNGQTA